ncbi:MAG: DUF6440 family protein [Erysipelotrichaceae bacterium]|nr:DUF6440 family protein [Erysipelotrichaceae bacterium]
MFGKKEKRFKKKSVEGIGFGEIQIVVDTVTGVNYLVVITGAAPSGITPLLDEYGNVVVDKLD